MILVYLAAPLLALITLLEWWLARGRGWHERKDSWGNIGCGLLEQSVGKLIYPILFVAYRWLYAHAVIVRAPDGWLGLAYGFALADLAFYGFHRAAHTIPVIWATHSVHHTSRFMNFTVAMRNGAFQRVFAVWFYLPLALIGVAPDLLMPILFVQIIYQFVLHTRFGGDLGPLGWILCAPAHHRVHHGRDADYVDRNFGAVLIVWDRMFGTFAPETRTPSFGVDDARLETANPIRANWIAWKLLLRM